MKSMMSPSLQMPRPRPPGVPVGGRDTNVTRGLGPRECQRSTAHAEYRAASAQGTDAHVTGTATASRCGTPRHSYGSKQASVGC